MHRLHHLFLTLHGQRCRIFTVLLASGAKGVALVVVSLTLIAGADDLRVADTMAPATINVVAIERQSGYLVL